MLDHMLFNQFKWIKDYVGKQITVPSNVNLYKLYGDDIRKVKSYAGDPVTTQVTNQRLYYGVMIDGEQYFIKSQNQNGGVLHSLLIHVWRAFIRFMKGVKAC